MTKNYLIEELGKLAALNSEDCEANHGRADDLLIEYINDKDVKSAYDAIDKWYA